MLPFSSHTCFLVFSPFLLIFSGTACSTVGSENPDQSGRERQLMLDRQSSPALLFPETPWLLQQALSTLMTLMGGEPSTYGGHCFSTGLKP